MEPSFQIVAKYSAQWPRNSEGSVAVFPDGRWLLTWSAFYDGFHDHSKAHLMARWSSDRGESWGEPFISLENDGKRNVLSTSVAVLSDGSVGYAHSRTDDDTCFYAWPYFRRSVDGGRTFSPHQVIVDMDTWHGFPANGRLIELSSGRLLIPLQLNTKSSTGVGESHVQAAYSDDKGESWKLSSNVASLRGTAEHDATNPSSASEPDAFERLDGTIMFLIRTKLGTIYAADSADGGETLSEAYDTGLESPGSPCTVARIPGSEDVLLVWNKAQPQSTGSGGPRTPLTTAISRDDGKTWGNFRDLEPRNGRSHMYPALAFDGETALVLYSEGEINSVDKWSTNWHNTSLKLARVPIPWLYE